MADGPAAGGPGFNVRPQDLKTAAPAFAKQSQDLKTALDKLKHSLADAGSPWGDDKQGKEFAQAYQGPHDHVLSALDVLVKGLASIHDGLVAHADNHLDADRRVHKDLSA
ncbi:WXG100 family type VII secretion target [Kitasatospora sp. NPDC050467]|uniref:WXG100 family type VII secretion target n=1 Tax=unclassified Kitasatospora TaxID=2633591 RepID=UPI00324CF51A